MNRHVKIFLKTGPLFGLAMGALFANQHHSIFAGIGGGILAGVLFGLGMAGMNYFKEKSSLGRK